MSNTAAIALLQQQRHLLQVEYQEEKEAYRLLTESIGLARKVTRGDAWFPLHPGRTYYHSVNQYCIEVTRQGDEEIDHNFEYGKPVVFFSAEAPAGDLKQATGIRFFGFTGTVSYVDGNRMVVAIPEGTRSNCRTRRCRWACNCSLTRRVTASCLTPWSAS